MAFDADLIADRRRLRRKLTFWRAASFLVVILAVAAGALAWSGRDGLPGTGQQVARVNISGLITGDRRTTELLKRVGDSGLVRGVVVSINSPGGTTSGSEELFQGIRALAAKKPTVAFVDGVAASGAYITAMGADRIVARETALVGSIGVLFQYPEFSGVLGKLGVSVEQIKSGPLKAEPSGFHPTTPEARAAIQSVVNDTFGWFKGLVAERRGISGGALDTVSDGRVFSARQGLPLRLVDQLGTERDAIAWLEREKGVPSDLPVRDWRPRSERSFSLWSLAALGADLAGLDELAATLRSASTDAAKLDGLLAVWQPPAAIRQ
ncbi:signal peptide peptidase SppA [Enterovirga aerilata]|uniref:Signal peptide peptidase SppA n=1 Tax=Enterovirga aerilata TaxID=2730920 RepID=A0A849I4A3_9HYPH|nr:signal peptide peptidase SppA [Enterovirga sp. DB1703]NNM71175.1 signal peptide peptidase SppA [Enterovirga sp. DB1703]